MEDAVHRPVNWKLQKEPLSWLDYALLAACAVMAATMIFLFALARELQPTVKTLEVNIERMLAQQRQTMEIMDEIRRAELFTVHPTTKPKGKANTSRP